MTRLFVGGPLDGERRYVGRRTIYDVPDPTLGQFGDGYQLPVPPSVVRYVLAPLNPRPYAVELPRDLEVMVPEGTMLATTLRALIDGYASTKGEA